MERKSSTDIFVSCGEASGDILGAKLLATLKKECQIEGVLGPEMRKRGLQEFAPMETLQVMGLTAILRAFPRIVSFLYKIKRHILKTNPKIVVLIDSPDFHLPLARLLKRGGYKGKIVQVVCPSIWAWRKKRKKRLEKNFDLLCTLFPFEKELFEDSPLEALYIGHPLVEEINAKKILPLKTLEGKKVIALFPGSRKGEILRHLPVQLAATKDLEGYTRAIVVSNPSHLSLITSLLKEESTPPLLFSKESRYALMQQAHFAIAKFGTITLELALLNVPTLAHFTLPPLEKVILQHIFQIDLPYYSLPNIIAQKEVFPEYLFPRNTLEELKENSHLFAKEEKERVKCKDRCQEVKRILDIPPSTEIFSNKLRTFLEDNTQVSSKVGNLDSLGKNLANISVVVGP